MVHYTKKLVIALLFFSHIGALWAGEFGSYSPPKLDFYPVPEGLPQEIKHELDAVVEKFKNHSANGLFEATRTAIEEIKTYLFNRECNECGYFWGAEAEAHWFIKLFEAVVEKANNHSVEEVSEAKNVVREYIERERLYLAYVRNR